MKAFLIASLFLLCASPLLAEREIPRLTAPVMDEAGLLSRPDRSALENLIRGFYPQIQMQIWTVPRLDGEPIENLAIRAVDSWRLGSEKEDNGILILAAVEDRQVRIEVGQGLEGMIPDIVAGRIIQDVLTPEFQERRYYSGLSRAAFALAEKAGLRIDPAMAPSQPRRNVSPLLQLLIPFFFLIVFPMMIFFRSARRVGRRGRGGFGGGWGGGFGGGFGGGGWSGGGGGFSGGGATGRW